MTLEYITYFQLFDFEKMTNGIPTHFLLICANTEMESSRIKTIEQFSFS